MGDEIWGKETLDRGIIFLKFTSDHMSQSGKLKKEKPSVDTQSTVASRASQRSSYFLLEASEKRALCHHASEGEKETERERFSLPIFLSLSAEMVGKRERKWLGYQGIPHVVWK